MSFLLCCKECTLLVINNFFFPLKDLFKCQGPSNKTQQVSKCEKKKKKHSSGASEEKWTYHEYSWGLKVRWLLSLSVCVQWKKVCSKRWLKEKKKKIQQTLFSAAAGPNVSVAGTQWPKLCVIPKTPNTLSASPSPPRLILLSVSSFGQKGFFFFFWVKWCSAERRANTDISSLAGAHFSTSHAPSSLLLA